MKGGIVVKKKKVCMWMICLCLLIAMTTKEAGAYDYREDKIRVDEKAQEIYEVESYIVDDLKEIASSNVAVYNVEKNVTAERSVLFDKGVHVYNFGIEEFIKAISGDLEEILEHHEWVVWEIPVSGNVTGSEYATVVNVDDFTTTWSEEPLVDKTYLSDPEALNELLEPQTFDSVYITAIPTWTVSFVTIIDGDTVRVAPYAYRSEWMGIENGKWYTSEEMASKLLAFQSKMENHAPDAGGGTASGIAGNQIIGIMGTISVLCGCAILTLVVALRKQQKEDD